MGILAPEILEHVYYNAHQNPASGHCGFISVISNILYLPPNSILQENEQAESGSKPKVPLEQKTSTTLKGFARKFFESEIAGTLSNANSFLLCYRCYGFSACHKDIRCFRKPVVRHVKIYGPPVQNQESDLPGYGEVGEAWRKLGGAEFKTSERYYGQLGAHLFSIYLGLLELGDILL